MVLCHASVVNSNTDQSFILNNSIEMASLACSAVTVRSCAGLDAGVSKVNNNISTRSTVVYSIVPLENSAKKAGIATGASVLRAASAASVKLGSDTGSVSSVGNGLCLGARSSFAGDVRQLTASGWSVSRAVGSVSRLQVVAAIKPVIQFIRGINEQTVPDVKLTRSRDGTNGIANFEFDQPSVFDSSRELGDITGLYMIDEEGTLSSVDVSAKFVNGKPAKIEARYIMRNIREWDRFMRFMERYAEENDLGFVKRQ